MTGLSLRFATAATGAIIVSCLVMVPACAHVVLVDPTPRTDSDYLYTFEEGDRACNPTVQSCNAFCGDAYMPSENPVTMLPVGEPVTIRWRTTVVHEPYLYRLSLNRQGTGDDNFDNPDNILITVSNEDAADPANMGLLGNFSVTVTIPEDALEMCAAATPDGDEDKTITNKTITNPCVLQLWDLYYFVSCANVLLYSNNTDAPSTTATNGNGTNDPSALVADNGNVTLTTTDGGGGGGGALRSDTNTTGSSEPPAATAQSPSGNIKHATSQAVPPNGGSSLIHLVLMSAVLLVWGLTF